MCAPHTPSSCGLTDLLFTHIRLLFAIPLQASQVASGVHVGSAHLWDLAVVVGLAACHDLLEGQLRGSVPRVLGTAVLIAMSVARLC